MCGNVGLKFQQIIINQIHGALKAIILYIFVCSVFGAIIYTIMQLCTINYLHINAHTLHLHASEREIGWTERWSMDDVVWLVSF